MAVLNNTIVRGNLRVTSKTDAEEFVENGTSLVNKYATKANITAGSYGDSSNQTPAYGSTFKVPYITVNNQGIVTGISEHTVKIPASDDTDTNTWRPVYVNGQSVINDRTTNLNFIPLGGASVGFDTDTKAVVIGAPQVYDWAKAATKPNYNLDEIGNRYQALIQWGGPALGASVSPVEVATIDDLGHNKFAFLSAASVVVQYSRDAGSTWVDYGASDESRRQLVTLQTAFTIGGRTGANNTVNDRLRVILNSNTAGGNIYTALKRLIILVSTNGSGGSKVKVECRTIANYTAGTDTWSDYGTYDIGGWSGWNSIPCELTFGGSSGQTSQFAQIRLTFSATSVSSTYGNLQVLAIRGIGFPLWNSPSNMATNGHLYSYDINQNATFPGAIYPYATNSYSLGSSSLQWGGIYGKTIYEDGTSLASKYVDFSSDQTISGSKTFTATDTIISGNGFSTTNNLLNENNVYACMRGNSSNPLFGLKYGSTKYYLQATANGLFLGPTSSVATSWDSSGNMTTRGTVQAEKDITLYTSSGDSPRLIFRRGTLTDSMNDWSLYDSGGYLYIQQRGSSSSAWETRATFTQSGVSFAGSISESGTALSSKYLAKSAFSLSGTTLTLTL